MQRSSDTVGTIAAALAKAQVELANPEKTLVGSVRAANAPHGEKIFRYAPLSSGLEIIRKYLGKHEIAVVQSTSLDQDTRLVKLCTILAHSSGEWISSEWPVCPINEIASPQRMGAALTYARRYALFTLVGIAGEDDLDAPETSAGGPMPADQGSRIRPQTLDGNRKPNGSIQNPEEKMASCAELLSEIASLSTTDQLTIWALRCLPLKNKLSAEDARKLEDAFHTRLVTVADRDASTDKQPSDPGFVRTRTKASEKGSVEPGRIDKSVLAIPTLKRQRNKAHMRLVAQQPCLVCAREPSDAHHVRFAQPRGLGLKVSDEFTVPLCRIHHREIHQQSSEQDWWRARGIDPLHVAHNLWQQSLSATRASEATPADRHTSPRLLDDKL